VADFGLARQMEDYEYKKNEDVIIYSIINQINENNTNYLLQIITGIIAGQMDGHRIPDGSHLFQPIGCLVLRDSIVGNVFSRQSSVSR
jgi:hypothetical protein